MAFVIYTASCIALVILLVWLWRKASQGWDDSIGILFVVVLVGVICVYIVSTTNRDTSRDDTGVITRVSIDSSKVISFKITQIDGTQVDHVGCKLEREAQCSELWPGTTVVVHTSYNSIGFVDSQDITQVTTLNS